MKKEKCKICLKELEIKSVYFHVRRVHKVSKREYNRIVFLQEYERVRVQASKFDANFDEILQIYPMFDRIDLISIRREELENDLPLLYRRPLIELEIDKRGFHRTLEKCIFCDEVKMSRAIGRHAKTHNCRKTDIFSWKKELFNVEYEKLLDRLKKAKYDVDELVKDFRIFNREEIFSVYSSEILKQKMIDCPICRTEMTRTGLEFHMQKTHKISCIDFLVEKNRDLAKRICELWRQGLSCSEIESQIEFTGDLLGKSSLIRHCIFTSDFVDVSNEMRRRSFIYTCQKKYGVDNVFQLSEVKEKIVDFNVRKYGVPCSLQADEIKRKIEATNLVKYGTRHHMQSAEFMKNYVQRIFEKYGVKSVLQLSEVKAKIIETNLRKYGVSCSLQADEVKRKIEAMNLERYGVSCFLSSEVFRKKYYSTMLKRYGVRNPMLLDWVKEKVFTKEMREKCSRAQKRLVELRLHNWLVLGHFGNNRNIPLERLLDPLMMRLGYIANQHKKTSLIGMRECDFWHPILNHWVEVNEAGAHEENREKEEIERYQPLRTEFNLTVCWYYEIADLCKFFDRFLEEHNRLRLKYDLSKVEFSNVEFQQILDESYRYKAKNYKLDYLGAPLCQ